MPPGGQLLIARSRVAPRAVTCPVAAKQSMGSVVHDGQRPAPSRELAGDRDIGDGVALLAVDELDPAVVESTVALIAADSGGGGGKVPASPQGGADGVTGAVVPGGLDEKPSGVAVAGLGDRPRVLGAE